MNPFLEHPSVFHDFHESLIPAIRVELVRALRPRYSVKIDETVYIHELAANERRLIGRPDLFLRPKEPISDGGLATLPIAAPSIIEHALAIDEISESSLSIVDSESREIVTVIELLSPSNKISDRDQYLAKRTRILRSRKSLVEIDLLRAGSPMPDTHRPVSAYAITVSRPDQRPKAGCWPFGLRDPIPIVPIPLKVGDQPTMFDLKPIIDRIIDESGYEEEIYETELVHPLSDADREWVRSITPSR